jgi:hypothetical protein
MPFTLHLGDGPMRKRLRASTWISLVVLLLVAGTAHAQRIPRIPVPRPPVRPPVMVPKPRVPVRPAPHVPVPHVPIVPAHPRVTHHPTPPSPTLQPAQVRAQVQANLSANAAEALAILARDGHLLPAAEQASLARQAIGVLAARVAAPADPLAAVAQIHQVTARSAGLGPPAIRLLEALRAQVQHRAAVHTLRMVAALGNKSDWAQAATRALEQQRHFPLPDADTTLTEVTRLARQVEALNHLQAIHDGQKILGGSKLVGWGHVIDPNDVPGALYVLFLGVNGLEHLRAHSRERWTQPPNVAGIKALVASLKAAIGDQAVISAVQQDLAVKALLDGQAAAAVDLLPENGSPEHAAELLRDVKALVLGEGEIETGAVGRSLTPYDKGDAPAPPPGVVPLLAEGAGNGGKLRVSAPASRGLTPLEEPARIEEPLRRRFQAGIRQERDHLEAAAQRLRDHLQVLVAKSQEQDQKEEAFLYNLESLLGQRLAPLERAVVGPLGQQGKKIEEVVRALHELTPTLPLPQRFDFTLVAVQDGARLANLLGVGASVPGQPGIATGLAMTLSCTDFARLQTPQSIPARQMAAKPPAPGGKP